MASDWLNFFRPYFATEEEAVTFVDRCESINRDYRPPEEMDDSAPKIMMHQTVRLMTISDAVRRVEGGHDPLSLMFMLICAECVAKLFDSYQEDGRSRKYVRTFFEKHVVPEDRQRNVAETLRNGGVAGILDMEDWDLAYRKECFYRGIRILFDLERKGKTRM